MAKSEGRFFRQIFYALKQGLQNIIRSPFMSLVVVSTMMVSLATLGFILLVLSDLHHVSDELATQLKIVVFIEDQQDLEKVASDIESFGAEGITIHPRPDERHIRYRDEYDLKKIVTTEFNIEGNPIPKFMEMVLAIRPTQVTLVPDAVNAVTSNAGWDTITHQSFLKEVIAEFKLKGIRTSIFIDTNFKLIEAAANTLSLIHI